MADEPKPTPVKIDVQLDDTVALGEYVNMARIFHNQTEFVLDAMYLRPQTQNARVLSRIILSPVNAKFLHAALTQNIQNFEKKFGPIQTHKRGGNEPGPILH